jgi:hypothetical protein
VDTPRRVLGDTERIGFFSSSVLASFSTRARNAAPGTASLTNPVALALRPSKVSPVMM